MHLKCEQSSSRHAHQADSHPNCGLESVQPLQDLMLLTAQVVKLRLGQKVKEESDAYVARHAESRQAA